MRLLFNVICAYFCFEFVVSLLNQGPLGNGQADQLVLELQRNFSIFQHEMELQLSLLKQKYTIEILVQNQTMTAQRQKIVELERQQKVSAGLIIEQNKTIANLDRKIADQGREIIEQNRTIYESMSMIFERNKNITYLEQKIADQDRKITDQDKAIVMLENTLNYNVTSLDLKHTVLEQAVDHLMLSQNAAINITTLRELDEMHLQQQKIAEMEEWLNQSFGSYQVILNEVIHQQDQHAATYTNQIRTLNQSATWLNKQFHYLALSVQDVERRTTLLNDSFNRKCMKYILLHNVLCTCI